MGRKGFLLLPLPQPYSSGRDKLFPAAVLPQGSREGGDGGSVHWEREGKQNALGQDMKMTQAGGLISLRQPANLVIMGTFEACVKQSLQ